MTLRYDSVTVNMGLFVRAAIVVGLAAITACNDNQPPSSPPPASGGETVTGRERIGWTQSADNPTDLPSYQYAVYVDGVRRILEGVSCAYAGQTADCTAPLPSLGAGRHTLQLASFFTSGDSTIEGARSASLEVTVAGVVASPPTEGPESGTIVSSDGVQMTADILARDLDNPIDLAVDRDHRVFVAERDGRVRIIDGGETDSKTAETTRISDDDLTLLSVTLGPDFAQSRFVYVAYAALEREQPTLRVVRFREVGNRLAEGAVITSQPIASLDTSSVIRFGPEGALYIGIAAGPNAGDAQRLASPEGKVLRLHADGSTPEDNPASSPVFSYGHRDPRGLAWHPEGAMWETEHAGAADEMNVLHRGANYGWPIAIDNADPIETRRRWTAPRMTLPANNQTSGLATIGVTTHPLYGDLIVSTLGAKDLLRIRVTRDGQYPRGQPARLLQGRFGRIAQVTAAEDGTLYFITANRAASGPATDMLVRLRVR